jgi:hypothetical protein
MKRQICSYDMVAVPSSSYTVTDVVTLITRYAVRFDPVDRIAFYSGIVRGLAPIRAELQAQMRADDIPKD